MKKFTNNFQLSKTLRFGLTNVHTGKKHTTHSVLSQCVLFSEKKIKELVFENSENKPELVFLKEVEDVLQNIKAYISQWEKCYKRTDQILLSKEYYKIVAKKACFDWFWIQTTKKGEMKTPTSSIITFSSLGSKDGIDRKKAILNYWLANILKTKQAIDDSLLVTKQIKNAILENKNHKEIDRVSFRKMFLSLIHLVQDTLIPMTNGSIRFDNISKLNIEEESNSFLLEFLSNEAIEERKSLLQNIYEIKQYFENNGANVPFAKATINKYTANQKPNDYNKEIDKLINKLGLNSIIEKLKGKDKEYIKAYFEFENIDKINNLKTNRLNAIERVQLFKYKAIPASVRLLLANHYEFKKNATKEEVLSIFDEIGNPQNIGFDYKNLKEKDLFSLDKYPLKQAFDYAWENLARYLENEAASNFPIEECKKFLKEKFNVDMENKHLKIYALLLSLKEKITTYEKKGIGAAKNKEELKKQIIDIVRKTELKELFQNRQKLDKNIIDWMNLSEHEQIKNKRDYQKAKEKLGGLRGQQKSKINVYYALTKEYQKNAQYFGKDLAELREKLLEKNEINKIKYLSYIIEDNNMDKYVLLSPLNENRDNLDTITYNEEGNLRLFEIKSLTSKTLQKIIKNKDAYKEFHISSSPFDYEKIKRNWNDYKNESTFIKSLKKSLIDSEMAKVQNWKEFNWDINSCKTYEDIEKEIDSKSYLLIQNKIDSEKINDLVNNQGYLLLPIVNQDITAEKQKSNLNQFTKDWMAIFDNNNAHRLHPEFTISFRQPTKDYPKEGEKRYSRFQMTGQFMYEYIPQDQDYLSRKEQINLFNDKVAQKETVEDFTQNIHREIKKEDYYVIGIDRGITQLATLCVLDKKGTIQGDFEIYTREFNENKKQWEHSFLKKRNILDISNLRVETTVNGEKVLVDLSQIKIKDRQGNGDYSLENKQTIKLKQLAYKRKLQFKMQHKPEEVLEFISQLKENESITDLLKSSQLISPYKSGKYYDDLKISEFLEMLYKFSEIINKNNGLENAKKTMECRQFTQLDASYDLKNGIVANMIGVVNYIMQEYNYKVFIALEDLTFAFSNSFDGINGEYLQSSKEDREIDFKDQENLTLAGLGTYHFFEMQLLKKLLSIDQNGLKKHLVPAFRSTENYEKIVRKVSKYVNYPFGIVTFINPRNTSITCPNCGNANRNNREKKNNDRIICKQNNETTKGDCGFDTTNFKESVLVKEKKGKNLEYITSGDANAAYNIALKALQTL